MYLRHTGDTLKPFACRSHTLLTQRPHTPAPTEALERSRTVGSPAPLYLCPPAAGDSVPSPVSLTSSLKEQGGEVRHLSDYTPPQKSKANNKGQTPGNPGTRHRKCGLLHAHAWRGIWPDLFQASGSIRPHCGSAGISWNWSLR